MRIWLDQVREEPFNWDETEIIPVAELERPELLGLGPVAWQGEVSFVDPGFLLRGQLSYDQTLACIRCLSPRALQSACEVELLIVVDSAGASTTRPARAQRPGARDTRATEGRHSKSSAKSSVRTSAKAIEHELLEDDLSVLVLGEEVLDTRTILLEQLQLNIPMKPLCRPDCRGLCPNCGADRNRPGACSCAAPAGDPRWAALASIQRRLAGSAGAAGSAGSAGSDYSEGGSE
jgi:uncharacterized metal-binding protein YceD (DUF177 family)